jgi:hypothetical protein
MRRWGAAVLLLAAGVSLAAPAALRLTKHVRQRMAERGVSQADVDRIVATVAPFDYVHHGKVEQGYYEPKTDIFLAAGDGVLITVITHATPRYVEKLRRSKPGPAP